jgi:hypothetical protein
MRTDTCTRCCLVQDMDIQDNMLNFRTYHQLIQGLILLRRVSTFLFMVDSLLIVKRHVMIYGGLKYRTRHIIIIQEMLLPVGKMRVTTGL